MKESLSSSPSRSGEVEDEDADEPLDVRRARLARAMLGGVLRGLRMWALDVGYAANNDPNLQIAGS